MEAAGAAGAPSDSASEAAGNNAGGSAATGEAQTTSAPDVLPHCLPHATTFVSVAGIFDIEDPVPSAPFDVASPTGSVNFSTGIEIYDLCGRGLSSNLFFDRTTDLSVDYHWLLKGALNQEICSGTLTFDQNGALTHLASLGPCVVPGTSQQLTLNLGTPTDVGGAGFDGIMQIDAASTITRLTADGNSEVVGASCAPDVKLGAAPLPASLCKTTPTFSVPMTLNLSTHEPLTNNAWHAAAALATSNLHVRVAAHDELGRNASFELYFRHEIDRGWGYHVLLADQETPLELASGTLQFDALGRLESEHADTQLRFPEADGSFAQIVALDFGAPIDSGGNGTDGVTAFSTATTGAEPPPIYAWPGQPLPYACGGEPTSLVQPSLFVSLQSLAGANTDPWPTSASATTTAFDVATQPWSIGFFWRHSGVNQVDFKFVATNTTRTLESSVGTLRFDNYAHLQHVNHATGLRLPMPDGSPGPAIHLNVGEPLDEGGEGEGNVFAAFWPVDPSVSLYADGFTHTYCF